MKIRKDKLILKLEKINEDLLDKNSKLYNRVLGAAILFWIYLFIKIIFFIFSFINLI